MSQGTLYNNGLARGFLPIALVKYLGLDVEVADVETDKENFLKQFPLGKIPAFVGPEGFKLTEVMAISYYRMLNNRFQKEAGLQRQMECAVVFA